MKYWSKSALSIYRYLETMSNSIDKLVLDTGKASYNKDITSYQSTKYQTNKIISLMDRKRKLINLKVIVEEGLACISKDSRRILTLFYIDGITASLIAQLLGISLRTFFRQKMKALNEMAAELMSLGYGEEFFEEEYLGEPWFDVVYNEVVGFNNDEEEVVEGTFVRNMLGDVGRIKAFCNTYI